MFRVYDIGKEWNHDEIKSEFIEAKSLGINVMRINLFWEDFQPKPDVISEEAVKKFDELIKICHEVDMKIAPTFFVGHMSGENWDVPWRESRNIYSDSFMLRHQIKLVRFFAEKYKDESAILFWDLSNEPDNYIKAKSRHDAWLWNYVLSNEIKKYDFTYPIELYLSYMPDVYKTDRSYLIYKYAKELSGIEYNVKVESPYIEVKEFDYDGKTLVLFINHEDIDIDTKINVREKTKNSEKIQDLISGRQINLEYLTIEANGVVAILLEKGV
ncbi:Endo-beta-mannanase-like protein [Thermoanaerobacter mathranii subsp. mathranii str. A3]|uniref:Endo-beta-mannanase-like protein n=1 Tax=Thermoanaerobacter mathranii subsp. mathranii (strain DSM 11426 / CCUG 53645 / CIP 108742 / A3) TaxID=583358 RepID=A0ABM5LMD6_THEM3|nr:Endo-beta-mannanase-like protein [Thermoanaerobacter mathranii subsp. mathranii str. A3]